MSNVQWRASSYCANGACVEVGAEWRKSSHSDTAGNCLEVGTGFHRSTHCANGSCVECANTGGEILVRDSKLDDSPILSFDPVAWRAFIADVCEDAFV